MNSPFSRNVEKNFKAGATAFDDASRFSFSVLVVYIFKKSTFCYLEPKVVINNNKNNQK